MTREERLTSTGERSAAANNATPGVVPRSPDFERPGFPWEQIFDQFSPPQYVRLLSQIQRQGLPDAQQVPSFNGHAQVPAHNPITSVFSGRVDELQPFRLAPIDFFDRELDQHQRDAVAKAVQTPDYFLLQGLPGTGKTRVLKEIALQAAAQGLRVLLVASSAEAIDELLLKVSGQLGVFPLRLVGSEESLWTLSPTARNLTLEKQLQEIGDEAHASIRRQLKSLKNGCEELRPVLTSWEQWEEIAERWEIAQIKLVSLMGRIRDWEVPERNAGDPPFPEFFTNELRQIDRECADRLFQIDSEVAQARDQIAQSVHSQESLRPALDSLRPTVLAKKEGRWWTTGWWRATLQRNLLGDWDDQENQLRQLQGHQRECMDKEKKLRDERTITEQSFKERRNNRIAEETVSLREECRKQELALRQELEELKRKWHNISDNLPASFPHPEGMNLQIVRCGLQEFRTQLERQEKQSAFLQQAEISLQEVLKDLAKNLPSFFNLIAAPIGELTAEETVSAAIQSGSTFDILVLQEANKVTESEFLKISGLAQRWILVGEADDGVDAERKRGSPLPTRQLRYSGLEALRPNFFQHVWRTTHCDPRVLPFLWVRDGVRLTCRLCSILPEQRQWLENEPLANHPEIELRILAIPRAEPALVEINFPSATSIQDAKQFVAGELERIPVCVSNSCFAWKEHPDRIVLMLTDKSEMKETPAYGANGIREWVVEVPCKTPPNNLSSVIFATSRIDFDRSKGWDRDHAETWVHKHLGLKDLNRSIHLTIPYRMDPTLAAFLSDFLTSGSYRVNGCPHHILPTGSFDSKFNKPNFFPLVEFVPVPAMSSPQQRLKDSREGVAPRSPGSGLPIIPRSGAGLELDLSDHLHRKRLPSEARESLPEHGYVNLLEAQAIVRELEMYLPNSVDAGEDNPKEDPPEVVVLALYAAQADLIRHLVRKNSRITLSPLQWEVNTPATFRERECPVIFLSLTRSHAHRPVTFGEEPQTLTLALTRARRKLVLFADPGTLGRRCQWDGPLDHLDADLAGKEKQLISNLLRYLQGYGPHQEAFRIRDGSCTPQRA